MPHQAPLPTQSHYSQHNRLLSALPHAVRESWFSRLQRVALPVGRILHEPGTKPELAWFPIDCVVSLNYVMRNGASAEVAAVGSEGILCVGLFAATETATNRAVVRSAGHALGISTALVREEFFRNEDVARVLLRHSQSVLTQAAQTAACNRHHSVDQQLSRWLLLSLDRLPSNDIAATQERIANMLGVRREGVTEAAGKLQSEGVIDYRRGHIRVLDRTRLESRSCECYDAAAGESRAVIRGAAGAYSVRREQAA